MIELLRRRRQPIKPHYHGHRKRLRQRFFLQGLEGFQDCEELELLLLYVTCQQDMKPVAKALIKRSGFFKNVLDAIPLDSTEPARRQGAASFPRE